MIIEDESRGGDGAAAFQAAEIEARSGKGDDEDDDGDRPGSRCIRREADPFEQLDKPGPDSFEERWPLLRIFSLAEFLLSPPPSLVPLGTERGGETTEHWLRVPDAVVEVLSNHAEVDVDDVGDGLPERDDESGQERARDRRVDDDGR